MKPDKRNCPPPPQPGVADAERFWKNRKPRFFPSEEPRVPEQGPSKMLPSIVAGTCDGLAGPLGHCNWRDGMLMVPEANVDAAPLTLYVTMQLLGLPTADVDIDVQAA